MYTSEMPLPKDTEYIPMVGGLHTEVVGAKLAEHDIVLKEKTIKIGQREDESDEEFASRQTKVAVRRATALKKDQESVRHYIGEEVATPPEHIFIAKGSNGAPAVFRAQCRVKGRSLREAKGEGMLLKELPEHSKNQLSLLLKANRKCFAETGHMLDLIGRIKGDKIYSLRYRLEKFLRPLENSSNIFLTPEGDIALVDLELQKSPLVAHILTLIAFESAYLRLRLSKV